ncbi:hypothetical protein Bca4012_060632 [Brassica carinata]
MGLVFGGSVQINPLTKNGTRLLVRLRYITRKWKRGSERVYGEQRIKGLMKLASSRERNQFQTLNFHSWVAVRMFSLGLNTDQGKHPRMKWRV